MSSEDHIIKDELWCFRSETAKLLGLSVTQIHTSLTDGENSVGTLTSSFGQLADFCAQVQALAAQEGNDNDAQNKIMALANNMSGSIDAAIIAFQFYDRLSQRMEHVAGSLDQLSHLIKDDENLNDPIGWGNLRDHIKSSYSLDAEHAMYEAIMKGASVHDALTLYKEKMHEAEASDDIELF
jgi:hypothetical protein